MRFLRRKLLILGMTATILLGLFLVYATWKGLLYREATRYAKNFSFQIKNTVKMADTATAEVFDQAFYKQLHRQPLAKMDQLTNRPPLGNLYQKVKSLFYDPEAYLGVFTDCGAKEHVLCYRDSDMDSPQPQHPLAGYEPKSRPWYHVTRSHTDWVLLSFMLHGNTLISPYPPTYGVTMAKHILGGAEEEKKLAQLAKDPKRFSKYIENENGIWIFFGFTTTKTDPKKNQQVSENIFLKLITQNQTEKFSSFHVSFENLRFPKEVLNDEAPFPVFCTATSKILEPLSYMATVPCRINGEPILFLFSKGYDHPTYFLGLIFAFFCLLYVTFRFFSYVEMLQEQNIQKAIDLEKGKMINAVGAKLVHDLKKGIVTQLDNLYQEFGSDFEKETAQPDFLQRLRTKLNHHFFYLQILHKYMNLLSNNLRRKKEENWVELTPEKFKEYLNWVLGPTSVTLQTMPLSAPLILECSFPGTTDRATPEILCHVKSPFPRFSVPEMAFYRILKNIWENFNAYGAGTFLLTLAWQEDGFVLKTDNPISSRSTPAAESTHLGMTIIHQLLEDNFGTASHAHQEQKDGHFVLEIFFPEVTP